jgi:hypothetical protein
MILHDEIVERSESRNMAIDEGAVDEAFRIEKVLNRAHEIHVKRGGLLGYDLEDWLQAERELSGRSHADLVRA